MGLDMADKFKSIGQYAVGALLTLAASMAAAYSAAVLYAHFYAYKINIPLSSLSEDYGMAFESVVVAALVFVLCFLLGILLTYRIVRSRS